MTLMSFLVISIAPKAGSAVTNVGLDAAAHKVRADLTYAQQLAMTTGKNHGVLLTTNNSYYVYRLEAADLLPVKDPVTGQSFSEDLKRYGKITMNACRMEFDSSGNPKVDTCAGGWVLANDVGGLRSFPISPSGLVEISPP